MLHIGFLKDFDMVILSNLEIVFYLGIANSPLISPVLEETAHFLLWMHSPFLECVLKPSKATAGSASPTPLSPLPALPW